MSERSELYTTLKERGFQFHIPYNKLTLEMLREAESFAAAPDAQPPLPETTLPPQPHVPQPDNTPRLTAPEVGAEVAGARLNTIDGDAPLYVEENGREWYQIEVPKPATPKPRARRVLDYINTGIETKTVVDDRYTETFEVPGQKQEAGQIKITLPSWQEGIYKDPGMPFRIHTYAGARGFNLFEVRDYFGGADLVPDTVKTMYVSSVLCYDIVTTVRTITDEYNRRNLAEQ